MRSSAETRASPSERQRWFDGLVTADLPSLVADKFAPLVVNQGFRVVEQDRALVVLESESLRCRVAFDPRGELDVSLTLPEQKPWEGWSYVGMTGRADLPRLLEIALERMEEDPRLFAADQAHYEEIAGQRRAETERLNAQARGETVKPREHRLP